MGKSTISMAIFHSYVKLPEGNGWMTIPIGIKPKFWPWHKWKLLSACAIVNSCLPMSQSRSCQCGGVLLICEEADFFQQSQWRVPTYRGYHSRSILEQIGLFPLNKNKKQELIRYVQGDPKEDSATRPAVIRSKQGILFWDATSLSLEEP